MKNTPYVLLLVLLFFIGCKFFSNTENNKVENTSQPSTAANNSNSVNKTSESPVSSQSPAASKQKLTKDDYVGRWETESAGTGYILELKEDGTGTFIRDENLKTEIRQNLSWKYELENAVFTLKKPIVNTKILESGTYIVHAKLMDDRDKLQTDFSVLWGSKGEDVFEKK